MKTQVYQIRALTNLHPGSGDADYGIVDKLVQRDPVTNYPTIHMSGIKGALREYFKNSGADKNIIETLFGSEPQAGGDKVKQGKLRFISAELLAMPQPGKDESGQAFKLRYVCKQIVAWLDKVKLFDDSCKVGVLDEGWEEMTPGLFKKLTDDLPVIARNYLDDGRSKNLWYEEYVPREAVFGCIVQGPEPELEAFNDKINEKVIQLGGNATVGYGYCLFTSIVKKP